MHVLKQCVTYMILNESIEYIKIVWNDTNNFLKLSTNAWAYNRLTAVNAIQLLKKKYWCSGKTCNQILVLKGETYIIMINFKEKNTE